MWKKPSRNDKRSRLINLYATLPVRSLRTLLDRTTVERDANGAPAPGTHKLARAREVINCWLRVAEEDMDFTTNYGEDEFHLAQEAIGACPECDLNDGIVVVRGEHWVVCHQHFVRWKADEGFSDFYTRSGFTVVTAKAPGVLRYTEIDYRISRHSAPTMPERFRFKAGAGCDVWKSHFAGHVLGLPPRIAGRVALAVCKRLKKVADWLSPPSPGSNTRTENGLGPVTPPARVGK